MMPVRNKDTTHDQRIQHHNNVLLGKNGRDQSNVWHYPGAGTRGSEANKMLKDHPTPKPVALLVDAILDVTGQDDIVFDAFGGSGSTLIACEQTRRRARVIEKDPRYCDLILRRWSGLTGEEPVRRERDEHASVSPRGRVHDEGEQRHEC